MGGCSQEWAPPPLQHLVLVGGAVLPQVGYSLCNSMATYKELENALQKQYYLILPLGGVIRMVPLDCRMVDAGFYCPGLLHPGVESFIAMSNKLLMHFGVEQL